MWGRKHTAKATHGRKERIRQREKIILYLSLHYAKQLKAAGFTEKQAEVQVEALKNLIDEKLATKSDIQHLEREIHQLEERLTNRINEMFYKAIISLGAIMVAGITVLGIVVKVTWGSAQRIKLFNSLLNCKGSVFISDLLHD